MERLKNKIDVMLSENIVGRLEGALFQGLFFIMSFLFGSIVFAGGISPFATGFLAGAKYRYSLSIALGSALGYMVFFGLSGSLRFVAAICLICLIKLGLFEMPKKKLQLHFCILITFFSVFFSSLAVFLATGGEMTFLVMCFCEALISAAFSCFTMRIFSVKALGNRKVYAAPADNISIIFLGCIILLSLCKLDFLGFSPARCLSYLIIMLFALCGKESASSIAGICCAVTLGLSADSLQLVTGFILSGLLCGLTGTHGKIPIGASLTVSLLLSAVLLGEASTAVIYISEGALSGMIFVFIPEKALFCTAEKILPFTRDTFDKEKERALNFTLQRSAKAVKDISKSVSAVSELLKKHEKPSFDYVTDEVKEDICKACSKYGFCWEKCNSLTQKAFQQTKKTLLQNGFLISEALPERITLTCRMPDKITQSFNTAYFEHKAKLVANHEIHEAKMAAARQFYCLGKIIDDAAKNLCRIPASAPEVAHYLSQVFRDFGFSVLGISAFSLASGKITVQVYCSHVPVIPDMSLLLEKMFDATGIAFMKPVADEYSGEGTVLSFTEECKYKVYCHTSYHTAANEDFSGDTCECFYDGTGKFYAVLSDGMGSGAKAAVDSVMTSSLISRLMRAGFSPECAIEAVNCALIVKSGEETLSTLDIFTLDLNTGEAKFYKAGAAASVINKEMKTLIVEKSSMPLGILKDVCFENSSITLSDGDTVILMSDGASTVPHVFFKELLSEKKNSSPEEISEEAVKKAIDCSISGKHDDITVTCIKIKKTD